MKQKLVITSNTSWFICNFFSSSIVEFMENDNEVYVIAPRDRFTDKLIGLGCHFRELELDRSGVNVFQESITLLRLVSFLKEINPDCVLNFTPKLNIYSVLICNLMGIKVINSVAGLGSIISENSFKAVLGRLLFKYTQPMADHIIFQNNDDKAVYIDNNYVKPENASRVKGIGIQLEKFVPVEAPDDGVVRFILYARMLRNKGVVDFVDAAKKVNRYFELKRASGFEVPKYEFALLGFIDEANPQGLSLDQLKHWDETTVVSYLGETDDVMSVVKDYDCVVLPSYYREGIPHCLIESCAMAKPIITTNNVGCKETVIDKVSGFIVQPQCVPDLAEAMKTMIKMSHQQRLAMGNNGRQKAEKDFCHIAISKHYMKTINSLID